MLPASTCGANPYRTMNTEPAGGGMYWERLMFVKYFWS